MSKQDYTYAVARIRALENNLLNQDDLNQLLSCPDEDEAVEWLLSRGWGDGEEAKDGETILAYELNKTWKIVRELVKDMSTLDVLSYQDLHHNIKGATKRVVSGKDAQDVYIDNSFYTDEELLDIVRNENWYKLPSFLADKSKEAYDAAVKTGDGQMLDVMMDKACLESIMEAGNRGQHGVIKDYAEETVAVTDIKIAVRAERTKKNADFMRMAMAKCETINVELLIKAALTGEEAIIEYVESTDYADGAEALKKSLSAFERWCNDRIIDLIKPQLRNSFSIGPIFAYIYAREIEIRSVRNILMGKRSKLPVEEIRERVRKTYV